MLSSTLCFYICIILGCTRSSLAFRGTICSILHPHRQSANISCAKIPFVSNFLPLESPNSSFSILWSKSAEILWVQMSWALHVFSVTFMFEEISFQNWIRRRVRIGINSAYGHPRNLGRKEESAED